MAVVDTAGDLREALQAFIDAKERQLQHTGQLGQSVLEQQVELEALVDQIREAATDMADDDEVDAQTRALYQELADTMHNWDASNNKLSEAFTIKPSDISLNTPDPNDFSTMGDLSREEPERGTKVQQSSAQSRRAKNAAHRQNDVEFAFEIGSGLLTEVRRLQSLLGERDKALQDMKEEKDDLEKSLETLRTTLRQQEQSADKFREENWNLEVTLQEVRAHFAESQSSLQRVETEHKRLNKTFVQTRETADHHKTDAERIQAAFDELKAKHEADVAQARKNAASLQREKVELQQSLDAAKAEALRASKRLPRFHSPLTPNGADKNGMPHTPLNDEDDVFGSVAGGMSTRNRKGDASGLYANEFGEFAPDDDLDASPSKSFLAPHAPRSELDQLRERLAHANRQINTLKGTLQREKEQKIEYRRMVEASPGFAVPEEEDDDWEAAEKIDEHGQRGAKPRRVTPYRSIRGGRGRGRGRGGVSLSDRFAMAGPQISDDEDEVDASPAPPVPALPSQFQKNRAPIEDNDDAENIFNTSNTSLLEPASKRTSVDGMDPAFANVLKRNGSLTTRLGASPSPLRNAVGRGGGTLRRRGGAAYQEARPASIVAGTAEALAAELGMVEDSMFRERDEVPKVETAEMGCQTDAPIENDVTMMQDKTVVIPEPVKPTVSDMGVQVDPEPVVPPPATITAEMSTQTLAPPVVERTDSGVQHAAATPPAPIRVESGTSTDVIASPARPTTKEMIVQTVSPKASDAEIQTVPEVKPVPIIPIADLERERRTTITQRDAAAGLAIATGVANGVSRSQGVDASTSTQRRNETLEESDVEDDEIQTQIADGESDSEMDPDAFEDARENVLSRATVRSSGAAQMIQPISDNVDALVTPVSAVAEDFHSIITVTDNELSDDDRESSYTGSGRGSAISSLLGGSSDQISEDVTRHLATYEDKGIDATPVEDIVTPAVPEVKKADQSVVLAPVAPVAPPKELHEMSIQTDAWVPPTMPATPSRSAATITPGSAYKIGGPIPATPERSDIFRLGSTSAQFQFISTPSPSSIHMPSPVGPPSREPSILNRPRTAVSDRRQSIESAMSSFMEDNTRSRTHSATSPTVDKTRPPTMTLPPPPRQPPPKNKEMPPPSFIPERKTTKSTSSAENVPPRPSSPPPPDLVKRATTPSVYPTATSSGTITARTVLANRQAGSSMPPSAQGVRQPPSTSSFRSAANAAAHAQHSYGHGTLLAPIPTRAHGSREISTTSLGHSGGSLASPRSSISSDRHADLFGGRMSAMGQQAEMAGQMGAGNRASMGSTDPAVIHAITQTMIGEFLYKYTRRTIGKGHGDRRHKRFFWVHPYTKTLYWGSSDPGSAGSTESTAKSAFIEGVRAVLDPNPMPPGLYQYSIVVSTPQREMKFTAPSKERHDIWLNALQFLLTRPGAGMPGGGASVPSSPMSDLPEDLEQGRLPTRPAFPGSPESQRSARKSLNSTPRGRRSASQLSMGGSIGKRSGTPAMEYLRWSERDVGSPYSPQERSFEHVPGGMDDDEDLDFELNEDNMSDDGYEGLENVRACCDGRHTVGHHHHHHHPHDPNVLQPPSRAPSRNAKLGAPVDTARPISPSGWSLRSRAGSTHSRPDGLSLFSRFGSRRGAKTPVQ